MILVKIKLSKMNANTKVLHLNNLDLKRLNKVVKMKGNFKLFMEGLELLSIARIKE
jgi:hypothetical protein